MLRAYIKVAALAGAVVFGFAQVAAAHGPSRKKVEETVTINAPPEKVWAVIGNFQDIGWVPGVKSTTGTDAIRRTRRSARSRLGMARRSRKACINMTRRLSLMPTGSTKSM